MGTSQDQEGGGAYRFGRFELRPAAGELRRGGVVVPLQRQPLRVLELLVSRAGEAVRRQEMFRAVWGEAVHVDYDRGLNYCIRRIRRALGDDVEHPLYVETLPRFGYRFIAPVTRLRDVGSIAVPGPVPTPASTRARLLRAALV
ncbi:MAG TPA: winged helix-turn-helix domain-containing protein, partial [Candidatus Polarisedimenticolia bacterium]|nr:winged helix-turn-helix domain-containing protein [Candidatus Polarisedimenticolia bacterium]